jgi:hypothetical protein
MDTDGHRLSPDPNSRVAPPDVALDDGLQDPDGLRTEAAERSNVAKTMILHTCSTENLEGTEWNADSTRLCGLLRLGG